MDNKRKIGPVTTGAGVGTAVAGSLGTIIGFLFTRAGIELPAEVSNAILVLISTLGTILGGYLARGEKFSLAEALGSILPEVSPEAPKPEVSQELPANHADYAKYEFPRENVQ
jgi:hypothetical protein